MWLVGVKALTTPLVLPYSDQKEQPQSLRAGEDPCSSAHSISWEGLLPVKLSLLQSAGLGLTNLMTCFGTVLMTSSLSPSQADDTLSI